MTNCKNCGAPIDIYTGKCPYCGTPYEAPGGSETAEKSRREKIQFKLDTMLMYGVLTPDAYRTAMELDKFDSDFNEIKTLQGVENAIGSRWNTDDDYVERAVKYLRGESLVPKWVRED